MSFEENKKKNNIVLWRSIMDWEYYTDLPTCHLFLHCLMKANYTEKQWRGLTIERGQFITSIRKLAGHTGLTEKQVRTSLNKLKRAHCVAQLATPNYSVITVLNYDKYQKVGTPKGKRRAHEGHTEGTQQGNNYTNINTSTTLIEHYIDTPSRAEIQKNFLRSKQELEDEEEGWT